MGNFMLSKSAQIVVPEFKVNARKRRVGLQYRLRFRPLSGDKFWTGGNDWRVRAELEKKRADAACDAHPDTLPQTCAAVIKTEWKASANVIVNREGDEFEVITVISFDIPDRERISHSTLTMVMTAALAACEPVVENYFRQVDHLIYGIEVQLRINDISRALQSEERDRAEKRINAEQQRADARARLARELEAIEAAVADDVLAHRAAFAEEMRAEAIASYKDGGGDARDYSAHMLVIDELAAMAPKPAPKPMLALPATIAA